MIQEGGRRCILEEGHDHTYDGGPVGTGHQFLAPAPEVFGVDRPEWANAVAQDVANAMGTDLTVIDADGSRTFKAAQPMVDDGDVTCGLSDEGPDGAAKGLEALWRQAAQRELQTHAAWRSGQRARVLETVLTFIRQSERDWHRLHQASGRNERGAIEDAKSLHDAQVAELLNRIGEAL